MGLTPKDEQNDVSLRTMRDWKGKREFQTKILASTLCEDKPDGPELFAVVKPTGNSPPPTCNLMIPIALVNAKIPNGKGDGIPKEIAQEVILAKRQGAEFTKENLTYSRPEIKDYVHMNIAYETEVYPVENYFEYVPVHVRNAATDFKEKYFLQYTGANGDLTREHITVVFATFK